MKKRNIVQKKINKKWSEIKINSVREQFSTMWGADLFFNYIQLRGMLFMDIQFIIQMIASQKIKQLDKVETIVENVTNFVQWISKDVDPASFQQGFSNLLDEYKIPFQNLLEKFFEDFLSLLKENGIDINENETEMEGGEMNLDINTINQVDMIKDYNMIERRIATFIFSFYTLLEIYSNVIFKISINFIPDFEFYEWFIKTRHDSISNPNAKLDHAKNNFMKAWEAPFEIFNQLMIDNPYRVAIKKIKLIRNKLAHKVPFIEIEEIIDNKEFSSFVRKVDETIQEQIEKIMGKPGESLIKSFLQYYEPFLQVLAITDAIMKYICLYDYVASMYLNQEKEEFIIEI